MIDHQQTHFMLKSNKKIKILYEISSLQLGGSETFLYSLIKHLDKKKFEPVIASFKPNKSLVLFRAMGIQTKIFRCGPHMAISKDLLLFLKKSKIDIVQSNYYGVVTALTAHTANIPHVWRLGGHMDAVYDQFTKQEKHCLLKLVYQLSSRIVCPSRYIKSQFNNFNSEKIKLIYNGIEDPELKTDRRSRGSNVAMIAHLMPQKRHIDFFRAAERVKKTLPEARFFAIGGRYNNNSKINYIKMLRQNLETLKMAEHVRLLGYRKDARKMMSRMSLIVLPSVNEGCSNAVLEAMVMRKPVIGADSGSLPELIQNGITGLLVPPKNPRLLSKAILKMLGDKNKMTRMGEKGYQLTKSVFDIGACAKKYERLYREVLNAKD